MSAHTREKALGVTMPATQRCEIESLDDFPEFAYANGWTDGLPVFPPTRAAVQRMIDAIGRDPREELGTVFPGDGVATIENVAANCVMAGCRPEYFPVVLAALDCITDPAMPITTTQSTGSASICTIVSGPIVGKLGFHTREWIFGPNGARANATIGRAVRLILWNIGRAHPGKLIKGTMGHPASWSYCIGEEQALSPWAPMHTDMGIAAADSAVTVMKAGEHTQLAAPLNSVGLDECITILARGIGKLGITTSGGKRAFLFVLNPSLARALADRGYSREKARSAIAERAFKYSYDWQNDSKQGESQPVADLYSKTPSTRETVVASILPDEIYICVGGGLSPQMGQCVAISSRSSAGRPFLTKPVSLRGAP
ncbi:MAG TPA: hypothetical protein VED01_15175 [Burkholderiales bacterium]|nr:hypothetical protein [Burkholderiales bacterium]